MPGKGNGLLGEAFHQAAVPGKNIGVMVHQILAETGGQHPPRKSHARGRGQTLGQRTGRGFHAGGMSVFGMTGRKGVQLAVILKRCPRDAVHTQQVQNSIQQHGAMAGRQNKTIPVGPFRVRRIKFQKTTEKNRGHIRHPHRHAGVSRVGFLHRIHRQKTEGIGHIPVRAHSFFMSLLLRRICSGVS